MGFRGYWVWFAAAVASVLAGATRGEAVDAGWAGVVAAARKEGVVRVYDGSAGMAPVLEAAGRLMAERYGIRLELSSMRPSEAVERVRIEQRLGRAVADLVTVGFTSAWLLQQEGLLQPVPALPSSGATSPQVRVRLQEIGLTRVMLPTQVQLYGVLVNTNAVRPEEEPRSWLDIASDRWRGRLILDDPRGVGGGFILFSVTYRNFGREYHERLAGLRPVLTRAVAEAGARVARGEFAAMLPFGFSWYARLHGQGLPVKLVVPREGAPYVFQGIAFPRNVRNVNAARVFAETMLAHEVQRAAAQNFFLPARSGVARTVDAAVARLLQAPLWGTSNPERAEELLTEAQRLYR
ncbi:MAG: ABC transporter substrate-binding protein [Armatimonadota bacterium]|nr:ABC transporter substrate-binding protein [Armatimonadota bacterium]